MEILDRPGEKIDFNLPDGVEKIGLCPKCGEGQIYKMKICGREVLSCGACELKKDQEADDIKIKNWSRKNAEYEKNELERRRIEAERKQKRF